MSPAAGKVQYKQIPSGRVAYIRRDVSDRTHIKTLAEELYHQCEDIAIGPAFTLLYLDSGVAGLDVEVCIPIKPLAKPRQIPVRVFRGGAVLSLVFQGPPDRIREGYMTIASWAVDHGINIENLSREIHISPNIPSSLETLTEIQIFIVDWEQRLAAEVKRELGAEACMAVMRDQDLISSQSEADKRALWIHGAVGTLDRLTGKKETFEILSRCAHTFSSRRIAELRGLYQQTRDVDQVLERMHQEPDWYENPEREGRIIYVTKIPANRQRYDEAVTREERRAAYCHCAIAYNHLDTMPPAFCNCGAGWYRQLWEGILQKSVRIEIIKSLTRQDDVCKFAIHLPPSVPVRT